MMVILLTNLKLHQGANSILEPQVQPEADGSMFEFKDGSVWGKDGSLLIGWEAPKESVGPENNQLYTKWEQNILLS